MPRINPETYTFGNNPAFEVDAMRAEHTDGLGVEIVTTQRVIDRVTINRDDYLTALDDLNHSVKNIEDPLTGKKFEIGVTNISGDGETVDAEISTFTSSITGNIGNAIE